MPHERVVRETVYVFDRDNQQIDTGTRSAVVKVPEGGHSMEDPAVDITWNREFGQVQIGIELPRERWIAIANELQSEDWSEVVARSIFSGTLTRHEVNNMIRVLRRARNAAFGADE